jgi:hypothetical protein
MTKAENEILLEVNNLFLSFSGLQVLAVSTLRRRAG